MSVVTRELPGRPDFLALAAADPERYPALLESAAHGAGARHDLLFALPREAIVAQRGGRDRFLDRLDAAWRAERVPRVPSPLPFSGGWCVFAGYELARECEPTLVLPDAPGDAPVAVAIRCRGGAIYDHARDVTTVFAEREVADALPALARALADVEPHAPRGVAAGALAEEPARDFLDGVAAVLELIAAGDVFQVNLSRGWRGELGRGTDPADVYAALRRANPSPFAGLFRHEALAVASSSPERLVAVRGRDVASRPIAGTRPRVPGDDDLARIRELVAHPKERAEHIMLIDLERNDLGRVCLPGSVAVDELMTIESYAHVHHLVSNVRGRLRPGTSPGEILRAVFPGGTITGCPKVRCMEIIAAIEREGRGPYTGALGYLGRDGDMDFNILIRTLWLDRDGVVRFRAGAGIVADSIPARELEETRAKARGLVHALAHAGG